MRDALSLNQKKMKIGMVTKKIGKAKRIGMVMKNIGKMSAFI